MAKDAKYGFGELIDLTQAEPVAVVRHGRQVVGVMAVEEFERLKALETPPTAQHHPSQVRRRSDYAQGMPQEI
jgi:PHD/YefM family antitoxin component YafN of YafNO toxin-antitoxin module